MKKKLLKIWYAITSFFIWRCEKCHGTIRFDILKEDGTNVYICSKCGAKYEISDNIEENDNEGDSL